MVLLCVGGCVLFVDAYLMCRVVCCPLFAEYCSLSAVCM